MEDSIHEVEYLADPTTVASKDLRLAGVPARQCRCRQAARQRPRLEKLLHGGHRIIDRTAAASRGRISLEARDSGIVEPLP